MSRKNKPIGICRLCGKETKLTFEHVPPYAAFNNRRIRKLSGDQVIQVMGRNTVPWDMSGVKSDIQQQGSGGYYLCQSCNNNTGTWYGMEYSKLIQGIGGVLQLCENPSYAAVRIKTTKKIRPLRIFKQIMVMFCDVNIGGFCDDALRKYLLDPDETVFDKQKYQVYAFIYDGSVERLNGLQVSANINTELMLTTSEIAAYPVGFTLYINKPDNYIPEGCNITDMADYGYDDEMFFDRTLPRLECNTFFSADYRIKAEIKRLLEMSE